MVKKRTNMIYTSPRMRSKGCTVPKAL